MSKKQLTLLAEHHRSKEQLLQLIQDSGFFSDFDAEETEILSAWFKAYSAPAGTVILKEGEKQLSLCIVVEGVMNIFKKVETAEGHAEKAHVKVAEIAKGASIGEMGVIDGQPLSASAVCERDAVILTITAEDFQNLIQKHSKLGVKILLTVAQIISIRLRNTTVLWADLFVAHKK